MTWVNRTAYIVAEPWFRVQKLISDWIYQIEWFFDEVAERVEVLSVSLFQGVRWLLVDKINELLYYLEHGIYSVKFWIESWGVWFGESPSIFFVNAYMLLYDWWESVRTVFYVHPEKILYVLTDGWLRYVWLVIDRWEDLYGVIEEHLEGWRTFVEDPAQALWSWIEPKLQQLAAEFLVKVW
jgi:hypothetical protein